MGLQVDADDVALAVEEVDDALLRIGADQALERWQLVLHLPGGGVEPGHPVELGQPTLAGDAEEGSAGGAASHGGQVTGGQVRLPAAGAESGQGQCRGPGS